MTETMGSAGIVLAGALVALGTLVGRRVNEYRRTFRNADAGGVNSGEDNVRQVEDYSPARYQPMVRLFAGSDSTFVDGNLHCPKLAARWRRAQRRIVRLYLSELAADFQRIHREARTLIARAPEPAADLVPIVLRQQIAFWRALVWVELRLAFAGLGSPRFDVQPLIGPIDALVRETARVSALA